MPPLPPTISIGRQQDPFSVNVPLPDLWQREAVRALKEKRDVVIDAPIGSGKTRVFELIVQAKAIRGQAIYTVPTRALANDKYAEWRRQGWRVGLSTGERSEKTDSPVLVATLETQRERIIQGDVPGLLVIDDYQLISEPSRGLCYELVLALCPPTTQVLLLSGSVANPKEIVKWLANLGRMVRLIQTNERPVPLEDVPVTSLPYGAPKKIKGTFARTAAEVLMADMGPLVIFAPQRSAAEKIAGEIARALPNPHPLTLTKEQQQACGKELSTLLARRVAFHHSGISYAARAGVIEPLAKAGHIRVVVATLGLSAGINFSLRSVLVAGKQFYDETGSPKNIQSDQLLQMYGRAGRRGLDENGFAISLPDGAQLADAAKGELRRSSQIDWTTLVRYMYYATLNEESPFDAARAICAHLFSRQRVRLGFKTLGIEKVATPAPENIKKTPKESKKTQAAPSAPVLEIFNSESYWETCDTGRMGNVPLELSTVTVRNLLKPALSSFHFIFDAFPIGRVCRLVHEDGFSYFGRELAIAKKLGSGGYRLTEEVSTWLGSPENQTYTFDQLEGKILSQLDDHLLGGKICDIRRRDDLFCIRIDFLLTPYPAYLDLHGIYLVEPPERTTSMAPHSIFADEGNDVMKKEEKAEMAEAPQIAPERWPAFAWKSLGLIDENGTPTPRGIVFSFFQGGDGLAVAAALEDTSYDLDEIILHLANLRAGKRFENFSRSPDSKLTTICKKAYGTASYNTYLNNGLPVGFGEGAAEALTKIIDNSGSFQKVVGGDIGTGDLERVVVEWISFLRHISSAPDYEWDRWTGLKHKVQEALEKHESLTDFSRFASLPPLVLSGSPPDYRLTMGNFKTG